MIAGHKPIADTVFDRLLSLPTLPWLRGTLCLILTDEFDNELCPDSIRSELPEQINELLFLPYSKEDEFYQEAIKEKYWMALRLCAQLGMIDGRGVVSVQKC